MRGRARRAFGTAQRVGTALSQFPYFCLRSRLHDDHTARHLALFQRSHRSVHIFQWVGPRDQLVELRSTPWMTE